MALVKSNIIAATINPVTHILYTANRSRPLFKAVAAAICNLFAAYKLHYTYRDTIKTLCIALYS